MKTVVNKWDCLSTVVGKHDKIHRNGKNSESAKSSGDEETVDVEGDELGGVIVCDERE